LDLLLTVNHDARNHEFKTLHLVGCTLGIHNVQFAFGTFINKLYF